MYKYLWIYWSIYLIDWHNLPVWLRNFIAFRNCGKNVSVNVREDLVGLRTALNAVNCQNYFGSWQIRLQIAAFS